MSVNSRRKGARAELEFIHEHLQPFWPDACRNIDQYGPNKADCLNAGNCHWQLKRTERLNIWAAITQAETEAVGGALPVVAFRRNGSAWYCVIGAGAAVPLLRIREQIWVP